MRGHDTMTEKREVEKIFLNTSLCRKRRSHGTCLHTLERLPGLEDLERWPRSIRRYIRKEKVSGSSREEHFVSS